MDRRHWLKQTTALGTSAAVSTWAAPSFAKEEKTVSENVEKLPVAAIVSTYHNNTHADVIIGKILEGYRQDGGPGPNLEVVSLWSDQVPKNDLSRPLAEKHGFKIAETIDEALTLGTDKLQVAGVLSVCEHGNYEYTEATHQHMYPRRRFLDGIVATFKRTGQTVPVFSDKHFSYDWDDAKHMYESVQKMNFPFMAGSSLPVAWREPALVLPMGVEIEEALTLGYGGLESYAFHALEGMQCVVERRKGGETGVKSVKAVSGDELWEAEKQGKWSRELLKAARAATPHNPDDELEKKLSPKAAFYLIEYNDGMKATCAMANGWAREFAVALKLKGKKEPVAFWYRLDETKPFRHFEFLLRGVNHMFHTGEPAWPVERTYLTTGTLYYALHSLAEGHHFETPDLAIEYKSGDWPFANQPKVGPDLGS